MRIALAGALACGAAAWAQHDAPAFAAANLDAKGVAAMASNCAICHGGEGRPAPGSTVPPLAGRPAAGIVEAMKAFREGRREATVMHQIAKGFGDDEIAAMAQYFARQRAGGP